MNIQITANVPVRKTATGGVNVESEQRTFSRSCAAEDKDCERSAIWDAYEFLGQIGKDMGIVGELGVRSAEQPTDVDQGKKFG